MNEVIELIEQKIEEIENYSLSNQENESQYIKELGALEEMLRIAEEI
jgi:Mg2+ and Co2+ transporter CorA